MSVSPEYSEFLAHLRDARTALSKAAAGLDLIGPAELQQQHRALDNLVLGIQTSAELIGERTGTGERAEPFARLDAEREAGQ